MYFNCSTLCQKIKFSNKKDNIRLRAKLTGEGLDDVLISKTINVQKNPGRGAKIVSRKDCQFVKQRDLGHNLQRVRTSDGSLVSMVNLNVKLYLGMDSFSLTSIFMKRNNP